VPDLVRSAADPATIAAGAIFAGKYRVLGRIGEGSFGIVYEAEHLLLGERYALKILRSDLVASPTARRAFIREAKAAMRFSHPNAIAIREFGIDGGLPYMTSDFVDGTTLEAAMAAGPFPARRAAALMRAVLGALAAAHRAGIVHRDLKPSNILLEADAGGRETPRVFDFGLARLTARPAGGGTGESSLSVPGLVVGTLAYASPEQAAGEAVDARSDLFACGAILYEMLTGVRPFAGETAGEQVRLLLARRPPAPSEAQAGLSIPPELDAIVLRALAREPAERFRSADEFAAALGNLFSTRFPGLLRCEEPQLRASRLRSRVAIAALAGLVAAAAGAAYLILRQLA
jgi:serine/threonine protein kinase